VIAKTFILTKDNSLISAKILRDNKIIRDHVAFSAAFANVSGQCIVACAYD